MEYNQLPKTIVSPITGNVLKLEPKSDSLASADLFDDCTEFIHPLAEYTDRKETIYIPLGDVNNEDDDD